MSAQLLDGKATTAAIRARLRSRVAALAERAAGLTPAPVLDEVPA